MSITIDKHVQLPPRRGGNSRGHDYPFDSMVVGDSFFVPGVGSSAATAAREYERRNAHRVKFATRALEQDPIYKTHGIRVWRTR